VLLALLRRWLHGKTECRVVPSLLFASERLTFRHLALLDLATQRARLTPGCVADLCTTARDIRDPHVFTSAFGKSYAIWREGEIVGLFAIYRQDGSFGIWVAPEHRRRGYGSETVKSFLARPEFAGIIGAAGCFEDNIACRRIIEGNGFIQEKRVVVTTPFCAMPRVALYYSRLPEFRFSRPVDELGDQQTAG
jgi:GNAT superfamily N-acetyltransferase